MADETNTPAAGDEPRGEEIEQQAAPSPAVAGSTRPKRRSELRAEREAALAEAEPEVDETPVPNLRPRKVEPKGHATVKRDSKAVAKGEQHHRVGPITFIRECIDELRKVVWPTGEQLSNYFVVVLVFVLFIMLFVFMLDWAFGWALLKMLG